jgi:thioredoxin 1
MIQKLSANSFDKKVLQSPQPVVVDVWAPWCGPCRAMEPELEAAAKNFSGQARFFKLNADDNPDLVRQYKVMGIPTTLYFRHGKLVARKTGVQTADAIAKKLSPLFDMSAEMATKQEITGLFARPKQWLLGAAGGLLLVAGLLIWIF